MVISFEGMCLYVIFIIEFFLLLLLLSLSLLDFNILVGRCGRSVLSIDKKFVVLLIFKFFNK